MNLTEFLLARIAEDEAGLDLADRPLVDWDAGGPFQRWDYDEVLVSARRAAAECEAKRRIVDTLAVPIKILMHLAKPYADHPDYLEEWRP